MPQAEFYWDPNITDCRQQGWTCQFSSEACTHWGPGGPDPPLLWPRLRPLSRTHSSTPRFAVHAARCLAPSPPCVSVHPTPSPAGAAITLLSLNVACLVAYFIM